MYAYEADSAYGYAQKLKLYDIAPIADKVTQDILIIGANQDHFINYKLIGQEINMFPNAKSLSFRLFTDKEEAQNHCNVGNGKLVLDTIDSWLDSLKKRDKKKSFFKERLIFYHSNTWQSMPNVRKASIASLTPLKAIFSAHSL